MNMHSASADGLRTLGHFVAGNLRAGTSGRFGQVFNPATGQVSGRVSFASAQETRLAVAAAREALPAWGARLRCSVRG